MVYRTIAILVGLASVLSGGTLTGSGQYTGAAHNLTALGNVDWASWGDGGSGTITPTNRKSGGGSLIGATLVLTSTFNNSTNTNGGLYWTDGTPTASQLATNGIESGTGTIGAGYSITFPASTTPHTVYIFVGGRNDFPVLTASLSDSSASPYTNSSLGAASNAFNTMFVLTYAANSSGQTLTVTYLTASSGGDVTLDGATYGTIAPASGGSLSGSVATQTTNTNDLTALGTTDWAEWGFSGGSTITPDNTKSGGGSTISAQAIATTITQYTGSAITVIWSNGTPNTSGSEATGIYSATAVAGNGFMLTLPADTNSRTLYVVCGGSSNTGQFGVTLSDGSAAEYLDASQSNVGSSFYALYTITYQAASSGQSLVLSWVQLNNGGNVTLSAAAYSGGAGPTFSGSGLHNNVTIRSGAIR